MILRDIGRIENPNILQIAPGSGSIFPCSPARLPTSPVKIPPPRFLSSHALGAARLKLPAYLGAHRTQYHMHMHASSPELHRQLPLSVTRGRRAPARPPPLQKATRPSTVDAPPSARFRLRPAARGSGSGRGGNGTGVLAARSSAAGAARSRTSSMASSATAANVQAVLARLDRFLKEKSMRPIDLFRSSAINTSYAGTAAEREASSAMRGLSGDVVGDDLLSVGELGALLKKLGMGLGEDDVRDVVAHFDTNGDGEVDVEEFSVELRVARRSMAMASRADFSANVAQQVAAGQDPAALWNAASVPVPASWAGEEGAEARRRRAAQPWGQRRSGDQRPVWGSGRQQRFLPSMSDRLPSEALEALAHLQQYLTEHRMRPVDLFRSKKLDEHSESAAAGDGAAQLRAKRDAARGSWQKVGADHQADHMSAAQLRRLLSTRELHLSDAAVDAVVAALDRDGNGEIDAKELTLALRAARRQS
jgi:Ca2+-binding EF-hand superfamily protein